MFNDRSVSFESEVLWFLDVLHQAGHGYGIDHGPSLSRPAFLQSEQETSCHYANNLTNIRFNPISLCLAL